MWWLSSSWLSELSCSSTAVISEPTSTIFYSWSSLSCSPLGSSFLRLLPQPQSTETPRLGNLYSEESKQEQPHGSNPRS
ncbi:BnaA05g17480D [Brassica napus]|uniref:BnaA05g17480D protein n=1 Tax=Brassica napus TaxID=3708 RepID=A0A078GE92_BRANA|nr:BnaA05g17480D [Brassica napus]